MMEGVARQAAALRPGRVALRRRQLDRQAGEARIGRHLALEQHHRNPLARQRRLLGRRRTSSVEHAGQAAGRKARSSGARAHWGAASASWALPPLPARRRTPRRRRRHPHPTARRARSAARPRGGRDWAACADRSTSSRQGRARGLGLAGAQLRQRAELERAVAPGAARRRVSFASWLDRSSWPARRRTASCGCQKIAELAIQTAPPRHRRRAGSSIVELACASPASPSACAACRRASTA